jgi:hypothetical protein
MTRFQLVFRRRGERDQFELRDNNHLAEPHIDGKLIVDGETYVSNGSSTAMARATPTA